MNRLLSILGPTASGKSSVALELARQLDGEIISCDSMQVYRGMDIGTAKASLSERNEIKHHLIDCLDIDQSFSARDFQLAADGIIRDIIARGKQPILCGGTGLYARALLYGFDLRPSDKAVASAIRSSYESGDEEGLINELNAYDPAVYERLKDNPRHWQRALEVLRVCGEIPSEQGSFKIADYVCPEFILMPSPELSRSRIRQRAEQMLDDGWIEETRVLVSQGLWDTPTAKQSIGYKLIERHLNGELARDELLEKIVIQTAQYAKRQRTWFRNQHSEAIRIIVNEQSSVKSLVDEIVDHFSEKSD